MAIDIVVLPEPSRADHEAILQPLLAYNQAAIGASGYAPLAIVVRDGGGATRGGLWGHFYYDWLFVELLVVPEEARGQGIGSKLLAMAEDIARRKACTGIWLDSFSFQAPGFYVKHGFEVFGTLPDYPKGVTRTFLRKFFVAPA